MFRIGEFSKLSRVPVSALRYYADISLLAPVHIDPFTNYRYYSAAQLPQLNRILALKDLGLSLDQIKQAFEDELSLDELRGMLRMKQMEIEQHVQEEEARLRRVATRLKHMEMEGNMPEQEVVLKTIEAQHALVIREIVPDPQHIGRIIEESYGAIMPRGISPAGQPFTIYHDEEFKPNDLDVEFVFPVPPAVKENIPLSEGRQLKAITLPGITQAACIIHKGDYDSIDQTYSAIARWIESSGYRIAGPPREVYLTAPGDPAGILTEIQYPVAKA